ncbi:MAG: nucleotide exchange factor GrpE [Euryarchaeota archaeon]|nr:nucleotide exchange factor GrpE [Euryarchaeota archaeon]|tara:strand:- start:1804 stop:2355 length:552 start_codon:yes stop_codon:yes gene_type:complete
MKSEEKTTEEKTALDEDSSVELSPEEQIEALKLEVDKYNEQFMRVVADFDNFRKRVDRDREQQSLRMKGQVISNFLDIIDTIDKAQEAEYPDLESSLNGISGIQKLVSSFMESFKIEKFVPKGEIFDFRFHEALTTVDQKGVEPNTVVDVIQSGYKLEGEVLRPAKVVVSKNSEEKEVKEEGE